MWEQRSEAGAEVEAEEFYLLAKVRRGQSHCHDIKGGLSRGLLTLVGQPARE